MAKNSFKQTEPLSKEDAAVLDLIDECRYEPLLFGKVFFEKEAFPLPYNKMHIDLANAYMQDKHFFPNDPTVKTLQKIECLGPRFHGKSELVTFLLPTHASLYHPQIINGGLQVICSETEPYAFDRLNTIKAEIEFNEKLNSVYGNLKGKRWQEGQFQITGEDFKVNSTMFARSTGQAFQGMKKGHRRPYFIWPDDVEGREDCTNPEMVTKNLHWLDSVVERSLDQINFGRIIYIATMMAENSMTHVISQRDSWHTMLYSAVQKDGSMLWPEGYSSERFAQDYDEALKEDRINDFWLEMMNLPLNPETKELRMEHIQYYSAQDFDQEGENKTLMHNYILMDPSFSSEKDSDVTGISVVGVNDKGEFFVHDAVYSSAKEPISMVDELLPLILKYAPVNIQVESFGAQQMLPGLIKNFLREEKINTPVYGMRGSYTKGAKAVRIRSFISKIKSGKVFFNKDSSEVKQVIRDFMAFPHKLRGGDYDTIDSISYAPQVTVRPKIARAKRPETMDEYMTRRYKEIRRNHFEGEDESRI